MLFNLNYLIKSKKNNCSKKLKQSNLVDSEGIDLKRKMIYGSVQLKFLNLLEKIENFLES